MQTKETILHAPEEIESPVPEAHRALSTPKAQIRGLRRNLYAGHKLRSLFQVDKGERPIMPPEFYRRCYATSYLAFISIMTAVICNLFHMAALGVAVFLTSINYWRHPTRGLRRLLDMAVVAIAFVVHIRHSIYVLDQIHGPLYLVLCGVGIACYIQSKACGRKKDYDGDSKFHMALHVMGNVANLVLYSGLSLVEMQR